MAHNRGAVRGRHGCDTNARQPDRSQVAVVDYLAGCNGMGDRQHGYPAIMVTDTAYNRNPHYHRASDTPDTLDYERMARVTLGLAGMLRELAAEDR